MSEAVLFYNERKVFFFDRKTNKELEEPLQIDYFNKFVSSRLSNLIQSNIIDAGMEIKAVITDAGDGLLIPNDIYNPEKKEGFYQLNYPSIPSGKILLEYQISLLNATMIYSCKKWLFDFIKTHFDQTPLLHSSSLYLNKILSERDELKDIHIVIKKDTFDIIKLKNKKLFSYNSIEYTSMSDLIYFIIGHIDKLNIDKPSIEIYGNEEQLKEIETIKNKIDLLKSNTFYFSSNTNFIDLIK